MLSSSLDTLVSKTTSPQKIYYYDCVTLYVIWIFCKNSEQCQGAISGQAFKF